MRYISTRSNADGVDFVSACLAGLAPDGGLYVPENWPQIAPAGPDEPYVAVASRTLSGFAGQSISSECLTSICEQAYASFAHRAVTPLVQWGPDQWILELHHGPTLAFKDVAMQFIGGLYESVLGDIGKRLTILCATSGDTGGAAAFAFAGLENVDLHILHPHNRVSPVQRRFMTSTGASNIHNYALGGDFDDCQAIVKSLFADRDLVARVGLSGVNSINWARIAAQTVYFAIAQAALGAGRACRFVVPSGNMGDALAGYVARQCGLIHPETEFICAVNENATLADFFQSGKVRRAPAVATPSPAMDITVPSNLERLIFELCDRDTDRLNAFYQQFSQRGEASLDETAYARLGEIGWKGMTISNGATLKEMTLAARELGYPVCPHTAVGMSVARATQAVAGKPTIVLSTAHAAKFPETVSEVLNVPVTLPQRCSDIRDRNEIFEQVPAELGYIRRKLDESTSKG